MRIVYLDCFSGISGDMTVAALVDAGAEKEYIEENLQKIEIEPYSLRWKRIDKRGISALKLDVLPDPGYSPNYHRQYKEIIDLIIRAGFKERVTALSLAIFKKIALAEAKIHDIPLETVHFHEVGAIDSIIDVVGAALALDSLDAERIYCSPVPLGSGSVRCDHGIYPVPAPATLELMKGFPIVSSANAFEMTTPTGAGIVAGVVDEFVYGLPAMVVESIGYGAGSRDVSNHPNVLRAVVGHTDPYIANWKMHHEHIHEESHPHHHQHQQSTS